MSDGNRLMKFVSDAVRGPTEDDPDEILRADRLA